MPTLTGLSVSATLLFAGLGTLLFHLVSKGKVPAFLGSSFAFIAGYAAIAPNGEADLLPYACLGVAAAGLLYLVLSLLFKVFGPQRVMRFFPPVVTGPIVICIGLILASSAISNCQTNWPIAIVAIAIIVVCNIWGRGMIRIIPILLGVIGSYIVAAFAGVVDFQPVADAAWIGLPVLWDNTVFSLFGANFNAGLAITAIITIMPLAFATIVPSTSATRPPSAPPAIATTSPNRGCTARFWATALPPSSRRCSARRPTPPTARTPVCWPLPACSTRASSGCWRPSSPSCSRSARSSPPSSPACPACVIGGVSLVLYGMISSVGIRNLVENHVDFSRSRNVLVTAIILVLSLGIAYSAAGAITFEVGSVVISLSGLAVGSIVGILLNIVLPNKEPYWDGGLAAQAEADDIPMPLEAELETLAHQIAARCPQAPTGPASR